MDPNLDIILFVDQERVSYIEKLNNEQGSSRRMEQICFRSTIDKSSTYIAKIYLQDNKYFEDYWNVPIEAMHLEIEGSILREIQSYIEKGKLRINKLHAFDYLKAVNTFKLEKLCQFVAYIIWNNGLPFETDSEEYKTALEFGKTNQMECLIKSLNKQNKNIIEDNLEFENDEYLVFMMEDSLIAYNLKCQYWLNLLKLPNDAGNTKVLNSTLIYDAENTTIWIVGGELEKSDSEGNKSSNRVLSVKLEFNFKNMKTNKCTYMNKRKYLFEAILFNKRIYTFGGKDKNNDIFDVDVFNAANSDEYNTSYNITNWTCYGTAILNTNVLMIGGYNFNIKDKIKKAVAWVKNFELPHENRIDRRKTDFSQINMKRYNLRCANNNGKIYAMGGVCEDGQIISNSTEIYDPLTNEWIDGPPMNRGRSLGSVFIRKGCIFYVGGSTEVETTVEMLNPTKNAWVNVDFELPKKANTNSIIYLQFNFK